MGINALKTKRILAPSIISTKQELLKSLRNGEITTSKYNLLSEKEKMFVELMVFGGYTGTQAIKALDPKHGNPTMVANRMLANPDVAETLEELSKNKEKKFATELASATDMALDKLKYIMHTSNDETIQAAAAKTILDQSAKLAKQKVEKKEEVSEVRFTINVENHVSGGEGEPKRPIIIEIDDEEEERAREQVEGVKKELTEAEKELKKKKLEAYKKNPPINKKTGMPYIFQYEGVNNYQKKKD